MSFMQSYFPAHQPQACTAVRSYSVSGTTMHLFLLSYVRLLLTHFSRLPPEWHFNVTHELAEGTVYPTVHAPNDDFKKYWHHHCPMSNVLVIGHLSKFVPLAPIL